MENNSEYAIKILQFVGKKLNEGKYYPHGVTDKDFDEELPCCEEGDEDNEDCMDCEDTREPEPREPPKRDLGSEPKYTWSNKRKEEN